jgi:hypothetical protein
VQLLCSSNGPLQNPQSEALSIKNKANDQIYQPDQKKPETGEFHDMFVHMSGLRRAQGTKIETLTLQRPATGLETQIQPANEATV